MVFDEDQAKGRAGQQPAEGETPGQEDKRPEAERRRGAGSTAAAAGAAGTGLGVGAGAGVVGAGEAMDHLTGDGEDSEFDLSGIEGAQERVEAAEEAARAATAATIDVFESRVVEGADAVLPAGVTDASLIVGDAVPTAPAAPATQDGRPDIGQPPGGGPPSSNRPEPEDSISLGDGPPSPGAPSAPEGADVPESSSAPEAPDAPDGPGAPEPPAFPGEPSFPSPPPGGPGAPTPPPAGPSGGPGEDAVAGEAPAPPGGPAPAPPSGPAPAGPGDGAQPPPPSQAGGQPEEPSDDVISEAPSSPSSPGEPGGPDQGEPTPPLGSEPDSPSTPDAPNVPGSSDDPAPPVDSEPSTPSTPDAPQSPPSGSGSPGGSEVPSAPTPPSSGGVDPGSGGPAPDPGSGSGGSTTYPYVSNWNAEGGWVDVMTRNDHGEVLHFRYDTDGSIYYIDDHGNYHPVEAEHLPKLLYVDEYGKGYFSVAHNGDTAYFSLDTYGERDWLHEYEIPGYGEEPVDGEYEYPRVVEYEYGDEGWALVQLEDGQLVKYYEAGGAYRVDEYGNETAINGFQIPYLLHVDHDGDAYFRLFSEQTGEYSYYMIDVDGGLEYIDPHDIPGYEMPDDYQPYEYPRTIQWDADEGWAIIDDGEGHYIQYYENGQVRFLDEHGNELLPNGVAPYGDLLYVDNYGNAYFRNGEEGDYTYFLIDHDGGIEYVDPHDIPNYEVEDEYPYEDLVFPEGAPNYFEFGDRTYGNPLAQNYEQVNYNADTGTTTYRYWDENDDPPGYDYVDVRYDGGGTYIVTYTDPDDPGPEISFAVHAEYGQYVGYEAVGGLYYDEWYVDHPLGEYEPVLPDDAPEYFEFGGQQWDNPEQQGYELFNQNGNLYEYRHPDTGEYISVNVQEDGSYYVNVRGDEQPGSFDVIFHVYVDGTYEAVDGVYYDEYLAENPPVEFEADGYLPEGAPDYFGEELWVNPETDPRFELYVEGHPEPGVVTRTYRADLDGDGTHDYQIVVIERADGSISVDYLNMDTGETEARVNVTQDAYGNYNAYFELHRYVDDPQGVPSYDEQEPPEDEPVAGAEAEIFAALPDNLPAYFEEERFPNPEQGGDYHYDYSEGDVHYFVNEAGTQSIRVWTNPNGNVTMAWHDAPPSQINASSQELVIEIQADGNWETTYYSDGPSPADDEAGAEETNGQVAWAPDGYLPEGAPAYFGDERWPNPETDDRFELSNEYQWYNGSILREYRADFDGDGQNDYRVEVLENEDGSVSVRYTAQDPGSLADEARIDVTQDAYGNYVGYEIEYLVDDPQGAVYEEPVEEPEATVEQNYLPDWLPNDFDGWPSPTQEGYEYQYTGTGGGYENHYYGNGQYTIMVTDYGDGTGRVLIDDLSNGQGWDMGYDLHDYGQYSVMDAYVPEEPEPEPEDEYLPEWLPESFDGWPSPVQEGFEYQYTGTGDGYENHFYTNGQYTIMVTDYGDGTGRVLIDDLSNGQGWDTGYDLYDYGQYALMEAYVPEEEEAPVEENYLPDWLPYSFDEYPSPVQEGFEYQYTGTGGGYENHFYTNGQYQIMVTDYGDGTGRVLIDDLSNGQGWDTGYDLYDYGQYTVMDEYASEMQNQIAFVESVEEVDEEEAAEIAELRTDEETEPGEVVETEGSAEEVSEIEVEGGVAEVVEEDLQFSEETDVEVEPEETAEPLSFDDPETEVVVETEAVVEEVVAVIEEESAEAEALEVEIIAEFEPQPQPALVEDEAIVSSASDAESLDDEDVDDGTGF